MQAVKLTGLSLGYDKVLYADINASALENELIGVIGPNGAGKSTLLKSIAGIIPVMKGEIDILGKNVKDYTQRVLASHLSLVPSQSPRTQNLSVFDMVSAGSYNRTDWLGTIDAEEERFISGVIERVAMEHLANNDSSKLSDGEYQRAAIARSLVQRSRILLLDEPTAFLDIENKALITKLLHNISHTEGKTIIFSTHDLPLAIKMCDKIWIMGYYGFIEGTPDDLIKSGAFEKIFKDSGLKFNPQALTLI